ncbi:hypothetical protein SAMD00019534_073860 [Acytostelium subglobosum LB1]|uniref:hypothetical protein n=1 Tax=Acytostelium subglobosum LB1 TaxID=1410327 RepID=UPI000644B8FF|nr:hypothetical protein SAMD00019534_073860 [Acytostelium subglobosum LB1]GAM24211.1 hypothetical protein SAMD00019534_073860 [Acytostelium subglobosum LB1]|eukprot:XP_012752537.1 hypothetical protein SAMD00019534_073860 [Acytostelium subglobosum LB1]
MMDPILATTQPPPHQLDTISYGLQQQSTTSTSVGNININININAHININPDQQFETPTIIVDNSNNGDEVVATDNNNNGDDTQQQQQQQQDYGSLSPGRLSKSQSFLSLKLTWFGNMIGRNKRLKHSTSFGSYKNDRDSNSNSGGAGDDSNQSSSNNENNTATSISCSVPTSPPMCSSTTNGGGDSTNNNNNSGNNIYDENRLRSSSNGPRRKSSFRGFFSFLNNKPETAATPAPIKSPRPRSQKLSSSLSCGNLPTIKTMSKGAGGSGNCSGQGSNAGSNSGSSRKINRSSTYSKLFRQNTMSRLKNQERNSLDHPLPPSSSSSSNTTSFINRSSDMSSDDLLPVPRKMDGDTSGFSISSGGNSGLSSSDGAKNITPTLTSSSSKRPLQRAQTDIKSLKKAALELGGGQSDQTIAGSDDLRTPSPSIDLDSCTSSQNSSPSSSGSHTWSKPSKIKVLLSRTSEPQLSSSGPPTPKSTDNMSPLMLKIGHHHWGGTPPDSISLHHVVNSNNKSGLAQLGQSRSQSETHIHRTSSKWVMAAPSSPPPNYVPPRPCASPTDLSPDNCLSPISSMIRVYYVPILEDVASPSHADTAITLAALSPPTTSVNVTVTASVSPVFYTNFWTQLISNVTTVKEVIEQLSTRVDRPVDGLRLCCTPNIYDYLDDDKMLNTLRIKKFYLMEVAVEMIVHEREIAPNLSSLITGSGEILKDAAGQPTLNVSKSWSPSFFCKFSTSNGRGTTRSGLGLGASPDSLSEDYLMDDDEDDEDDDIDPSHHNNNNNNRAALQSSSYTPMGLAASVERGNADPQEELSAQAKEKIKIMDNYFRHYYRELETYLAQRKKRMESLVQALSDSNIKENSIAYQRCIRENIDKESTYLRQKRAHIGPSDFRKLSIIGKGGFGIVYLAIKKDSNEIITLKVIRKSNYHRANQMTSVSKEKEVMMIPNTCRDNNSRHWITRLLYSFQDANYLYLGMEYHCGGDFKSLLSNLVRLSDDMASFYFAEMILAIESLHKLGYIHRDIKPSNFVLDKFGHIKLIDFGLSRDGFICHNSKYYNTWKNILNNRDDLKLPNLPKFKDARKYVNSKVTYSKVGSPDYMGPEMLTGKGYDNTYDYWSLGVVLFEMLFGDTPFAGETAEDVFKNIIDWKKVLDWDYLGPYFSDNARDLLQRLLCEPEKRLTPEELKLHPFFDGIDWENIKNIEPPFVPQVQSDVDLSYFVDAKDINEEDGDYEEVVEAVTNNADNEDAPQAPEEQDETFRSMPFGGFNFQRFPSIVEGARAKGLIKSFYVEERCMSRATSNSSLTSPANSCTSSPTIQSANGPRVLNSSNNSAFNSPMVVMNGSGGNIPTMTTPSTPSGMNPTSPTASPSLTSPSPTMSGYTPKIQILRVGSSIKPKK